MEMPWFGTFANFCGINISIVADLKLLIWWHWMQSQEGMCTNQHIEPISSTPLLAMVTCHLQSMLLVLFPDVHVLTVF